MNIVQATVRLFTPHRSVLPFVCCFHVVSSALNIPFTHAMSPFYCLVGMFIANVILLKCYIFVTLVLLH